MKSVRVFAPATVANLAVGYDILGLAIQSPGDEVIIREGTRPGLHITEITGDGGKLPKEILKNTAGYAAMQLLKKLGKEHVALEMQIHKKMEMGTGLGSSAASAVAGVYGVNAFLDFPLTKKEILRFAVEGEQIADGAFHGDNVAPSLLGGIVLVRSNEEMDVIELPVPENLFLAMVYPHIEILTSESRAILSDQVQMKDFIGQTGNIAAFTSALYTSDYAMLGRSLQDLVIEPQRAQLIPEFYALKNISLEHGALGFSISGAGPSMFALCDHKETADKISIAQKTHMDKMGITSDCFTSPINTTGAYLID